MLKLGRKDGGEKYTPEELSSVPIDDVKKMIEHQVPGAFSKKAVSKKSATKKSTAKKATPKPKTTKKPKEE